MRAEPKRGRASAPATQDGSSGGLSSRASARPRARLQSSPAHPPDELAACQVSHGAPQRGSKVATAPKQIHRTEAPDLAFAKDVVSRATAQDRRVTFGAARTRKSEVERALELIAGKSLNASTRAEIVVRLAPLAPPRLFGALSRFGIVDVSEVVALLKRVAADPSGLTPTVRQMVEELKGASPPVDLAKAASEADRIALIELALARNVSSAADLVNVLDIRSQSARVRLALFAVRADPCGAVSEAMTFGLKAEKDRIAIGELAASTFGFSAYVKNLRIGDEDARVRLAKLAAAKYGEEVLKHIANYQLSPSRLERERFDLARLIAASYPRALAAMRGFGIEDRAQLLELAKISARVSGWIAETWADLAPTPEERADLAVIAAKHHPEDVIHTLTSFDLRAPEDEARVLRVLATRWPGDDVPPYSLTRVPRAVPALAVVAPRSILSHLLGAHVFDEEALDDPSAASDLRRALRTATDEEGLFDPGWVDKVWDRVQDRELGLRLLGLALQLPAEARGFASSMELLCRRCGLPQELATGFAHYTDATVKELLELTVDMQARVEAPLFAGVVVDSAVLADKRLVALRGLFANLRDLLALRGPSDETWTALRQSLLPQGTWTEEAVGEAARNAALAVREEFTRLFASSVVSIDPAKLDALRQRWGSLDTLTTLTSRLAGNPAWRAELPVLGEVLRAELDGTFEALKFNGAPSSPLDQEAAQAQLARLKTPAAAAEWRRERVALRLHAGASVAAPSDAAVLKHAKVMIGAGLIAHVGGRAVASEAARRAVLDTNGVRDPQQRGQRLLASGEPASALAGALVDAMRGASTLESLETHAGVLRELLSAAPDAAKEPAEALRDLKALRHLASQRRSAKRERSLVFTWLTSRPKPLLEVGDLVATSSCQNFRTGCYVQTLLGYVKDANVKALLSFSVGPEHFTSGAEFQRVADALAAGVTPELSWNGELRELVVKLPHGAPVLARLPYRAHLRQMVKLGAADSGRAGVVLEPEYLQVHPALATMQASHAALARELSQRCGAALGQRIRVPASRNPGGVYSDRGGGVQLGDYVIG